MTTLPYIDEQDLLTRLREGDYMAFEAVYHQYKKPIAANLFRLLKSRELVEETLQELFLKLWENRENIQPGKPVLAYLHKVAVNLAHDYFRKAARDKKLANTIWESMRGYYTPSDEINQQEADEALYKVIDGLPAQRRRVFIMCKLESKSYEEVSKLLDISVAAVNDHITKANKFLKQHYPRETPFIVLLICDQILQGIK